MTPYQACSAPQCGQPTDVVTDALKAKPHMQEYSAVSSGPPPRRAARVSGDSGAAVRGGLRVGRGLRRLGRRVVSCIGGALERTLLGAIGFALVRLNTFRDC
jgi:hypothetical protein